MITASSRNFFSYQAAFYLAEWCIANRQRISGMTVVELGSGAGLVGLTCYKICKPRYVTMTDFHPKVMETLRYNVENNQIITPESTNPPIDIQPLDWMEFYQKNESSLRADLVLASGK
jgi:predicted nicotinamide N-methyase